MRQRGAQRKGSELHPCDGDARGPDDAQSACDSPSRSRVSTALGWLQHLLLLASLAVVCSSSFDIASGRAATQSDDILSMLRLSAAWICGAIAIGLYLFISNSTQRASVRVLLPSPPRAPLPPPHLHEDLPSGGGGGGGGRTKLVAGGGGQRRRLRTCLFSDVAFRTTPQQTH